MEINEIVSAIENLTLIQASELVKALEEKFGVTAAAPVAAAAGGAAPAAAAEEIKKKLEAAGATVEIK